MKVPETPIKRWVRHRQWKGLTVQIHTAFGLYVTSLAENIRLLSVAMPLRLDAPAPAAVPFV